MKLRSPVVFIPLTLVLMAVLGVCLGFDIDGDTFGMHLVNDTDQPLEYRNCKGRNCENPRSTKIVEPGDFRRAGGALGVANWWQVRDTSGNILGCYDLLYDERPKFDLITADVQPCPD